METFNVLLLPFLAFQTVIRTMELIEIFELSQTSRHMFSRIKLAKKRIFPLRFIIIKNCYRIQVCDYKDKEGEDRNFKLNFSFLSYWHDITRTLNLNGKTVEISLKNGKNLYHPGFFAPLRGNFFFVADYLLDLFSCPRINLFIDADKISVGRLENPMFLKCSDLEVCGAYLKQQQLLDVMEHTKPNGSLYLGTNVICHGFDFKQIVNMTRVYITDARLVSIDDLLNMKCEVCVLGSHILTQDDITHFIRRWLSGSNPQLVRLRINKFKFKPNFEVMLKGTNYKKWDGKRRPRYFITDTTYSTYKKDFKDALDFEGDNSRLASVMQTKKHFEFVVWPSR